MITLKVNGKVQKLAADPGTPLLWVLRDTLALTGTKYGCGMAQCGGLANLSGGQDGAVPLQRA